MGKKSVNKSTKPIWIAVVVALTVWSGTACRKQAADCFTSTGTVIRQMRIVADFDTIVARENVDIILTQDSVNSVEVEAGEKIIGGIRTDNTGRKLEIGNTNTCNWVRSYNKPLNVYVHVKNLKKIYYLSAGNITTTNVLTPESLIVDVWGGCGTIDLSINVTQAFIYEHMGTADITVRGRVLYNSVVSGDFGFLQMKDLVSDYAYISNTGTNDCYINVTKYLDAAIGSIGNIYYTGKPDTVLARITGSGELIEF